MTKLNSDTVKSIKYQIENAKAMYKMLLKSFDEALYPTVSLVETFRVAAAKAEVAYFVTEALAEHPDFTKEQFLFSLNSLIATTHSLEGIQFGLSLYNLVDPWWESAGEIAE